MESFNGREISTTGTNAADHHHLMASAFGAPQARGRAAEAGPQHPVEPHPTQPAKPIEPPTHPVEPPTNPVKPPTHPVEPPTNPVKPPTHPVEPPTNPVEPPTHPTRNQFSPPAETFHPNKPQKQDVAAPPKEEKHTPVADHPVTGKPVVPVTPPERSHAVPPPEKTIPVAPPEKHHPVTPPEHHRKPGELHITIDHDYKSDEEHRTIQHRVEHAESKFDKQKHTAHTAHEKSEHHASHSAHHSDSTHHSTHHHSTRHHGHGIHHGETHHGETHHSTHHADTHHATNHHETTHHADTQHKAAHDTHQKDTSHVADQAQHVEKKKDVDVTTIHVDKKHVEEHTHIDMRFTLPEVSVPVESKLAIEPSKEPVPAPPKAQEPTEKVQESPKIAPVEPLPVVPSPPAEPTKLEKPAASHTLKPADTNEISTAISPGQVAVTLTHEHHIDPRTYYRASVNAGVAGDHVGLGNTNIMVGRHLFSPYDKDGNPTRGNLNIEGGLVLKTGHTYDFGKLPRFGDTSLVAGVNGYYEPTKDLTLYGAAQRASSPKQYDLQFGAIKDSGRFSFQLGGEVSNVDGYGTSHFLTPGMSYRLNKNTSVYVSGAIDMDGHRERSAAFTGFRVNF